MRLMILIIVIFLSFFGASCVSDGSEEGEACETNYDCPVGKECVDGTCVDPGSNTGDSETGDDSEVIDDGPCEPGTVVDCYSGPEGTSGVGPCVKGQKTCKNSGDGYGPCEGEVTPEKDKCTDSIDNDCNGTVNDGFESGAEGCVCIPGSRECLDAESLVVCNNDGTAFEDIVCDPLQGLSCVDGACNGPCSLLSLGTNYIGCDYYPTVTANSLLDRNTFFFAVAVSNSNSDNADITVTQNGNQIVTDTVPGNSMKIIQLNWTSNASNTMTTLKSGESYRLRSTKPITLYQFNPLDYKIGSTYSYSNDASLLMPTNAWGKEYIVAARASIEDGPGFYSVLAAQDGTTVTVTPSITGNHDIFAGAGINMDGTGTVTLNEGDILHVSSAGQMDGYSVDITGTMISADKPIQVIGGHNCTYVPFDQYNACDHLEESMFPLSTLGKAYIVSAPWIQPNTVKAVMTRIIAADEGTTTITYDPADPSWPTTINGRGSFIEIDSEMAFKIVADKRILVAQYMKGQGAGGGTGDPALSLAVPVVQYRDNYLFHAPVNYDQNFVNIIASSDAEVTLDGAPVTGFIPIGTTGFSTANVLLNEGNMGNHTITSASPFFINVYGYGDYTSYWYPGGLNLIPQK